VPVFMGCHVRIDVALFDRRPRHLRRHESVRGLAYRNLKRVAPQAARSSVTERRVIAQKAASGLASPRRIDPAPNGGHVTGIPFAGMVSGGSGHSSATYMPSRKRPQTNL
jgi:hypothetical protein